MIFLVAVLAVTAQAAPMGGAGATDRTVRDIDNRFTVMVPAAWKVTTSHGDPALTAVSPPADGGLPASLVIIVRDLPVAISPETCVYQAQYVTRRAIQRYASLDAGPEHVGPLPAWSHAYVWTSRTGEERRSIQICVTVGRRAILAIGTTGNRAARVRDDMPELIRSIQSIRPATGPSAPGQPRRGE
ncbi:MAG TPA: hypothetical protein VGX97_11230 [bacterium]|nr:hypothetical protein [bacterium]